LSQQELRDEYGPEYFATGCGRPYERTAEWLNFFSVIADQIIRTLHPRRVLDAGCAMGFLVEAFWDRGVYCEGIDISKYAISKVRRDIKDYCSVGSLTDPIPGRFDLITCIEVLEHLRPETVRSAVANLCAASDVILFSSTPSDLDEPTHHNVRPPIYWLQLFSEFDFWPDARLDASFLTLHAMVLRKGPPPSDDFLRLFSEYIRFKTGFHTQAIRAQQLDEQVKAKAERERLATAALEESNGKMILLEGELAQAGQRIRDLEQDLSNLRLERDRAAAQHERHLSNLRVEGDRLISEVERVRSESTRAMAEVEDLKVEQHRLTQEIKAEQIKIAERDRLIERLQRERAELQATLTAVLSSRAWRLAEKCRRPLNKVRRDWPHLYKGVRFVARRFLKNGLAQSAQQAQQQMPEQPKSPTKDAKNGLPAQPIGAERVALDDEYQRWIDEQEPKREDLLNQRRSDASIDRPVISVVVPVYHTQHSLLRACIQSVLEQTYGRWELCIAAVSGGDPSNWRFLRELAQYDGRVRLVKLDQNGGISNNSNAALALATGDFIALLDHDDTLAPFALFEVANHLQAQPDLDIIYSDHDYLDPEQGLRCAPLFKPGWSPEIMYSANYITHLTVLRRSLVEEAGRFDPATDGAQDWDLFFRLTEKTSRISHIPKVLYHWRMHAGSTAHNESAKSYVADAQLLAVRRHLRHYGMNAEPEIMSNGLLHVTFQRPSNGLVSIIIPTKDRVDLLSRCISTILEVTRYENFEIIIVDNGSRESASKEYFKTLAADQRIRILWNPGAFNYSAANNRGAREANGEFLLFLNNDVEITQPDWLTEFVSWADCKPIGVVGGRLLRPNGTIQHAGVILGMSGFADHPFADQPALTFGMAGSTGWYRNFLAVTGACIMIRRDVFDELGGFDEKFILCGSDVEICLRAHERGYRILYNPFAELIHHEQQTRNNEVPPGDYLESFKHYRRWLVGGDPYWNINLSLWQKQPAFRSRNEQSSLEFAEKHLQDMKAAIAKLTGPLPPSEEDFYISRFDCSEEQLNRVRSHANTLAGFHTVKRVMWFIPSFEHAFYGGIFTILRFAEYWRCQHGVRNLFAICDEANEQAMASRIRSVYPDLEDSDLFVLRAKEQAGGLPPVDANICTLWTTAYYALYHADVVRRFYFIQDFEPAFYRAGSISALVENTYRMGLFGIANTISLKKIYESEYGGRAVSFKPCVNESIFFAPDSRKAGISAGPQTVFCYGRPGHARNSFELLTAAMKHLKSSMGDRVRIVSAGAEWNPANYGLQGIIDNLGILAYEDTGRLYRESDIGVVMMLTRHPSYIPLELMASGCLVVTNVNSWTSWLLKDGENCLLAATTATTIAEAVERGLRDTSLRESVVENALALVRSEYTNWSPEMEKVYKYMCDPDALEIECRTSEAAAAVS
jgi:GT2 family glycosyltransferase/SAM-dependent methyltransferase